MELAGLTLRSSYRYLMSEETFLPTAISHKFWVVSSTTFNRELQSASRNVNSKKKLREQKKVQYCFFLHAI